MGDQGRGPARAQVLRVDRWVDPLLAEHLPADVDLQGRVRRVRPHHRAQEVLLSAWLVHHPSRDVLLSARLVRSLYLSWVESKSCGVMLFFLVEGLSDGVPLLQGSNSSRRRELC